MNGSQPITMSSSVVQEATATGDPEILKVVLEGRDVERYSSRVAGIPTLLQKLKEVENFVYESECFVTKLLYIFLRTEK